MNASTVEGRVLSKWVDCRRRQGPVCEQKMAVLHVDRLTPDRSPFKSVEIIKIAHSLETDSFSVALRRFIGRRGQIKEIRSDNGTNFTGARENLGNPSMHETTTKSMRLYYRRISCGYLTPPPLHMGQLSTAFGKAVFTRSKRRILCRDAGGDKCNIMPTFFVNDGLENICPCSNADKGLAVGNIVLIRAENSPRNTWPLGRVVEVRLDWKSLVRRVKMKVKKAVVERSIDKLCLLLEAWAFSPKWLSIIP